jgi:hypothetical protein
MRMVVVGALICAGLTTAAVAVRPDGPRAFGQQMDSVRQGVPGGLFVASSTTVGDKYEQLRLIDPVRRVILVYHVELGSGDIELRCVRNIESDSQIDYYNGKSPLPPEIRSGLDHR